MNLDHIFLKFLSLISTFFVLPMLCAVLYETRLYSRHLNAYFVVCPSLFFTTVAFVVTILTFSFLSHPDFTPFVRSTLNTVFSSFSLKRKNKSPDLFVSGKNITLLSTLLTTIYFSFL